MPSRLEQLRKLLEKQPDDPFLLYASGIEYRKLGESDRAIEAFERAIVADANYLYAYYQLAQVLEELGQVGQAGSVLRRGIANARALGDTKALGELQHQLDLLGSDAHA